MKMMTNPKMVQGSLRWSRLCMISGSAARRENKKKVNLEILTMKKALRSLLYANPTIKLIRHLKTQVKLKDLKRNTNLLRFLLNHKWRTKRINKILNFWNKWRFSVQEWFQERKWTEPKVSNSLKPTKYSIHQNQFSSEYFLELRTEGPISGGRS